MKKFLFILFLFITQAYSFAQTNTYDSIYVDGRWRTFAIHLPNNINTSILHPLVLAFHGGSANSYLSLQYQSRLSLKADTADFIVVYPEGIKTSVGRTWNGQGCCAPATSLNINDIKFVSTLLDTLFKQQLIDTTKVYATGFSNGAILSYHLANHLSSRFAAIATVEGCLLSFPYQPAKAIPIISFHSYQDLNIPYFGGLTIGPSGTFYPPQDSVLSLASANATCTILKDTLFHDVNKYDHFLYSDCSCNTVIEQYVSYDGEHSWAGGLSTGVGISVSNQFNATFLMWKFFQNYSISCGATTNISDTKNRQHHLNLFPNPTTNILTFDLNEQVYTIILYNSSGTKITEINNATGYYRINCSELEPGIYLVRASNNNKTLQGKFLKN